LLTIKVPVGEGFDNEKQKFVATEFFTLELEHSLASLSKWEAIYEKPFLASEDKSTAEVIGYILAMTRTPNVPAEIYTKLSPDNLKQVNEYINAKMTATTITELNPQRGRAEVITSEIIYYWMVSLQIPFECETGI
jgi:hypothetical protein